MNKQEIFDKVVRHLIKQNTKALTPQGACVYKTDSGLKCAVGCLIKDEDYVPTMEGGNISILLEHPNIENEKYTHFKENNGLLQELQIIHDRKDVKDWPGKLKQLAIDHNLKYPIICEECA